MVTIVLTHSLAHAVAATQVRDGRLSVAPLTLDAASGLWLEEGIEMDWPADQALAFSGPQLPSLIVSL